MHCDQQLRTSRTVPPIRCCRRLVGRAFLRLLCRQDAGSTLRCTESLRSLVRKHWDDELMALPLTRPSASAKVPADKSDTLSPNGGEGWGEGVPRFMGSPHFNSVVHWGLELVGRVTPCAPHFGHAQTARRGLTRPTFRFMDRPQRHRFLGRALLLASLRIAVALVMAAEPAASSRPVPPPGIRIPDQARKELEAGAQSLAQEIDSLRVALREIGQTRITPRRPDFP